MVQPAKIEIETLIIHVHGGGFIATSSATHQNYLRQFANACPNAVVFSIDYRLAPANRFPCQVDDCWQVYCWLILNAKRAFGIEFKRVVLTGDSAGGNLILSMTLMCINRKFRVPDSLLPFYPSSICSPEIFWPSILNALDDPLLNYTLLF